MKDEDAAVEVRDEQTVHEERAGAVGGVDFRWYECGSAADKAAHVTHLALILVVRCDGEGRCVLPDSPGIIITIRGGGASLALPSRS